MTQTLGHLHIEDVTLNPSQEWPVASGSWHFVRVQTGGAYWLEAKSPRALAEGEMLIIGPRTEGSIRASQINEVVLHGFHFLPDLLCGFFTLAERHAFETACTGAFAEVQFLPSTHPASQHLASIIAASGEPPTLARRAELLGLVVSVFDGGMPRHCESESRALSAQRRFQQLILKMPDNELLNHTPENLAQLCGCSPRHFSRLFQQHFGISARERQTELRLTKAAQILTSTSQAVAHVAQSCGYRNISLFNSMFKKRFGMTPSEWRQKDKIPATSEAVTQS